MTIRLPPPPFFLFRLSSGEERADETLKMRENVLRFSLTWIGLLEYEKQ